MNHKFYLFSFLTFASIFILNGCDFSRIEEDENAANDQTIKTINNVLLNNDNLIYLVDNELYQYRLTTEDIDNIFTFESKNIQFETSQDPNKVIFQVFGEDNNKDKFITLSFDNSTGGTSLTQVDSSLEPDEEVYGEDARVNHSRNKVAVPGGCINLCHLNILELEDGITVAEHPVDYAGELYPTILWSPDDRFLAYLSYGPYGFHRFYIFDTAKDQYGTGEYLEDSSYYDFKSYSTSVSVPGAIDLDIYDWIDENTIVLKAIEELGSTFWTYNADTESLQEIASVKSSDEWIIQAASISKDLKTISYIKARGNDNEEQELWISSVDGLNASLIYKNYSSTSAPTSTTEWETYSNDSFSFNYPTSLALSEEEGKVTLKHSVPYEHYDTCDLRGSGVPLQEFTDFNVSIQVMDGDLIDSVLEVTVGGTEASQEHFMQEYTEENSLKIESGFIDSFSMGAFEGFRINISSEYCGGFFYHFPISQNETLVIYQQFITELIEPNSKTYLAIPEILASGQAEEFFTTILSSLKVNSI